MRHMLERALGFIDRLSGLFAYVAALQLAAVVGAMIYEVVARYGFGWPTLWAGDIVYMMNGTLFLLASGWTLVRGQHVRIDFLSTRFSPRVQHALNAAFYIAFLLPALAFIAHATVVKTITAYQLGELEQMSAWEPVVWPFLSGIALGLVVLALQVVAQALRHLRAVVDPSGPDPLVQTAAAAH